MNHTILKLTNADLQQHFDAVEHKKFQKGRTTHWHIETENGNEYPTVQSFCWLYCWAKTGMNSSQAKEESERAFNLAFSFTFAQVDNERLHALARRLRYAEKLTSEDSNELIQCLTVNQ